MLLLELEAAIVLSRINKVSINSYDCLNQNISFYHKNSLILYLHLYQIRTKRIIQFVQKQTITQYPFSSKQMKSQASSKRVSKSPTTKTVLTSSKKQAIVSSKSSQTIINSITKDNYDIMNKKFNITQIEPLQVKYVLRCVQGLFKDRFLYITTHKEGEIIGSGDAKQQGLTLQIQAVGLSSKHCKLKFNGFRKFYIKDYGSVSGTWLKISAQGIQIKNNDTFRIGPWLLKFQHSNPIPQIEQLCQLNNQNSLSDILLYNKITNIPQLHRACYNKFNGFPFTKQQIDIIMRMSQDSKNWFEEDKDNKIIVMSFMNEEVYGLGLQIGWQIQPIHENINKTLQKSHQPDPIATINKGMLIPKTKAFTKIHPNKNYPLNLHDQLRIGDLTFQLTRFNIGTGQSIGNRQQMQDSLIIQQDIGGSEWKLISLYGVIDGYGGNECMLYIKNNIISKIKQWTCLLDQAGDINEMLKLLMSKTYYQLDYQFHKLYPQISLTCGATILCIMIIQSKIYSINLGDNYGILYRNQNMYKISIDHIPSRIDQKIRIQDTDTGSYVQYNRLNGKCTISRAFGQFQYKNILDYQNNMKGKIRSGLLCIPEVLCFDIMPHIDDFIILSTDGLYDGVSIKAVIDFVIQKAIMLDKDQNPNKIVSALIENNRITNPNCDNMAVVLIFFKKGKIGKVNSF